MKAFSSAILAVLAGCAATPGSPDAGAPDAGTGLGKGEGKVVIVAWIGYVERGENDPAYDWVTKFEKDTGCQVETRIAGTSDEMVRMMNEGGVDLVTASGDASLTLVYGDRVRELDLSLIPSWNKVDPRLQDAPWHTVGGKHFGVPYQWGANVLLYDTTLIPDPPKTWGVVFEETTLADGKSNKGRVQAYDGPIYLADAALHLKHTHPELGIGNIYELERPQFEAAVALLAQQHALVDKYWHDATVQVTDFQTRGMAASGSWPYQVNTLLAAHAPVASVVPADEGATGWADTTMMHRDAPHPNCAYRWLEHSLEAKVQGDVAAWFGSVPAVPDACQGNELLGAEGCRANGSDHFAEIAFWRTPVADCGDGRTTCVPYHDWVTAYDAIRKGE